MFDKDLSHGNMHSNMHSFNNGEFQNIFLDNLNNYSLLRANNNKFMTTIFREEIMKRS